MGRKNVNEKDKAGHGKTAHDRDRRDYDKRDKLVKNARLDSAGSAAKKAPGPLPPSTTRLIEVICNDRLGKKIRVKCSPDDTVGDFKKLLAAQTGTAPQKIVLKKWYNTFKDAIRLSDYEIHNGMSLEMYYS